MGTLQFSNLPLQLQPEEQDSSLDCCSGSLNSKGKEMSVLKPQFKPWGGHLGHSSGCAVAEGVAEFGQVDPSQFIWISPSTSY